MEKKRLFVAISLAEEIRNELARVQQTLKPFARDVKWVKIDNVHVTLKFLGYVEFEKIDAIKKTLAASSEGHGAFEILVKGVGFFPNERRPAVFWAGMESPELLALQSRVEDSAVPLGFEKEERPCSPHLTLARFREPAGLLHLVREAAQFSEREFGKMIADHLTLYESTLRPQGPIYTPLEQFRL